MRRFVLCRHWTTTLLKMDNTWGTMSHMLFSLPPSDNHCNDQKAPRRAHTGTDIDRIPLPLLPFSILQSPFISHDANSNLIEHSDLSIEIQLRRPPPPPRARTCYCRCCYGNVPRALMWETLRSFGVKSPPDKLSSRLGAWVNFVN